MNDVEYLKTNGVDVNHGLELLGDMETYNSIMGDFLDAYQDRMKRINDYKNMNDMPNYAIEVHSLKSDSKYLGFMSLADIAYKHEMASKAGDVNTVNASYNDLVNEANKVINVVNVYLGKTSNKQNVETSSNVQTTNVQDINNSINKPVILVADDSSIIRNFVKDVFTENYEVVGCSNGREVADFISKNLNNVAVLLLDLNMPDINGFQVLEWFKVNNLFSKIPVSIISGADDKESIDKAFKYPICDMLQKPFERETVKAVVEKTINFNK